ncbi:MAG: septation protein SepH [Acidimicrobiia bacterium]
MPKLHLVGITPDHRGLVLSEHVRAKRGDMVLEIDERLLEAIDKAQRLRTSDEGQRLESNALPTKRDLANGESGVAVRLTPREIQQRLRAGETVTALARSSGTDEAWIQRFAAPVLAEKAVVIERARSATFTKRGVGPSAAALGPAVAANVIDKGVPLTLPDLEAGWGAYQHPEGGWHVTFTFPLRGRRQTAEWEVDPVTGDLAARNKLGSELAWRESAKKLPKPKPVKAPAAKKPAATKAASASPPPPDTAPADEAAATTQPTAAEPPEETVQALPLTQPPDRLEPGEVREVSLRKPRKPPSAPKAAPKEPARPTAKARPTSKAPATKRAAAASTETPAQSVATVPSPEESPEESMPPTDLDVVDVVVDLRVSDDQAYSEDTPEPPGAREPAPIGSPPAPQGGPPAP